MGFINGINTTSEEAFNHAEMLSNYSQSNIHGVYNKTFGIMNDLLRASEELEGKYISKASNLLKEEWINFLKQDDKNTYLQIGHSEGTIIIRNALEETQEEYRKKITVLAIAPAAYIDEELCKSVSHFRSRDFVPLLDLKGLKKNKNSTIKLTPSKNADLWDHSFSSDTYKHVIQDAILGFKKNE
jgi:hypothetical protein